MKVIIPASRETLKHNRRSSIFAEVIITLLKSNIGIIIAVFKAIGWTIENINEIINFYNTIKLLFGG